MALQVTLESCYSEFLLAGKTVAGGRESRGRLRIEQASFPQEVWVSRCFREEERGFGLGQIKKDEDSGWTATGRW